MRRPPERPNGELYDSVMGEVCGEEEGNERRGMRGGGEEREKGDFGLINITSVRRMISKPNCQLGNTLFMIDTKPILNIWWSLTWLKNNGKNNGKNNDCTVLTYLSDNKWHSLLSPSTHCHGFLIIHEIHICTTIRSQYHSAKCPFDRFLLFVGNNAHYFYLLCTHIAAYFHSMLLLGKNGW
jgi:hypothetical protein